MKRLTSAALAPGVSVSGMMRSLSRISVSFWWMSRKTGVPVGRGQLGRGVVAGRKFPGPNRRRPRQSGRQRRPEGPSKEIAAFHIVAFQLREYRD